MNRIGFLFLITLLAFSACKEKSSEHEGHDATAPDAVGEESANTLLYNEVMKIHDEVMPKMNDIQRKKEALKNQIASNPDLPTDKKQAIENKISRLDSAGESMMQWMRQFNPLPDSTGEEKARDYLEGEMEKVKKVCENILQALKEAEEN